CHRSGPLRRPRAHRHASHRRGLPGNRGRRWAGHSPRVERESPAALLYDQTARNRVGSGNRTAAAGGTRRHHRMVEPQGRWYWDEIQDHTAGGKGSRLMKTILIVDDEPAAAARGFLTTDKPDLLLLDVVLPGEDGLTFLKWLRQEGHEQPVLMVSALDTAKSAVEALQLGAADYLVKGYELEELRQRV